MRALDLVGKRFGRLVVAERLIGARPGVATWRCHCDCGGTKDVISAHLSNGTVSSCGCLVRTHGHSSGGVRTKTYMVWDSMLRRCNNQNHRAYPDYGGRGITVCDRWRDFNSFLEDMGEKPEGFSLDRIDNSLGYSKENCRWATSREQNRNTRGTRMVTCDGESRSVIEWSELNGWPHHVIASRLRAGWSEQRAVSEPWKKRGRQGRESP